MAGAESGAETRSDTTSKVPVLDLYPGELGLILVMWVPALYMWYASYRYSGMAGFFPRVMAVIVFALSSVLLFRAFLPDPVRNAIEGETGSITDTFDQGDEEEEDVPERNSASRKTLVVGFLTGAYMIVGYLIGLLWATPAYVYIYLRYTDYPRRFSAIVSVITFVIAFAMMEIFRFPLETGWIHDALGFEQITIDVVPRELVTIAFGLLGVL